MKCAIILLAVAAAVSCQVPEGSGKGPDLAVTATSTLSGAAGLTDSWPFTVTVTNKGTADAAATTLKYAITNAASSAYNFGFSISVPALAVGATFTDSYAGTIGSRLTVGGQGTDQVTITADPQNTLGETNLANTSTTVSLPLMYTEVVIETYDPSGSETPSPPGAGTGYCAMDLYSAAALYPASPVASDPTGSNPNSFNTGFAFIDYKTPLAPGNYYAKVYEAPSQGNTDAEAYAIRVLLTPSTVYTGQTGAA